MEGIEKQKEPNQLLYFNQNEVDQAMEECNFNKGIGPDGFDCTACKMNQQLRCRVTTEIAQLMYKGTLPKYLREGRLVPLSRVKESNNVKLGDIRPIVVKSHLSNVVQKTLLQRIKLGSWHLLETQYYSTGFKDG